VKPPLISIALISASALAYEILLMRLLSITQWHHFAYMIISLALLGYGVSGTFLALVQDRLKGHFQAAFLINATLFGLTALGSFLLVQSLPFNALELLWDLKQPLWLLAIYLLLFIPFFCAANCICLSFSEYPEQLHRIYSFDLLGAGAGAIGIIVLLFLLVPMEALKLVSALGLLSALTASWEFRAGPRWLKPALGFGMAILLLPGITPGLRLSEFKGLSQALRVIGARQVDQRSSPLGLLSTVSSPTVPFRYVPGLSLNAPAGPPAQLATFTDGDGISVITRFTGDLAAMEYLDQLTSALPYHLLDQPKVLVLGAGGGTDVLQALYQGASRIDAVELNPQVVELVNDEFADFSGALFTHPRVSVHISEARGYLSGHFDTYDLVQLALLDSFSASSAGLYALSENYLYTVEALGEILDTLRPGGILAITRWIKLPPRDGLKIFATAAAALERAGVAEPGQQMAMIRGWNTSTLLLSKRVFSAGQVERLRAFSSQRWFDLIHYPGIEAGEANRYNQLQQAWFFNASRELLGTEREQFFENYKFNIRPATDNRPYFFHFLKWRTLPEILSLRGQGGLPLLEQGYLILVVTLAQAALASLALILLPLWLGKSKAEEGSGGRWRVVVYFFTIGVSFMLIEIAFIQKFILFLSHPLYAVAVVLSAFLVFAGLGSAMSERVSAPVSRPVAGIVVISLVYLFLLPPLFQWLMPLHDINKILISTVLIAPLAFLMGMPFPLGLSRVARHSAALIPWAWGINGCASVLSAILATILAIHAGFIAVVLLAVVLYMLAAMTLPGKQATIPAFMQYAG
jgi:SAM-dependent methyltransferase